MTNKPEWPDMGSGNDALMRKHLDKFIEAANGIGELVAIFADPHNDYTMDTIELFTRAVNRALVLKNLDPALKNVERANENG